MQYETLSGPEKAAILILSMDPEQVKHLLARLEDDEVERILAAVSRFEDVPPQIQERVLTEFTDAMGTRDVAIRGGRERAMSLVERTLEEGRAKGILEKLNRDELRIDWTLRQYEPPFIAEMLNTEHPQTIAVVLSQIPAHRGAAVIEALPEEMRPEVVLRLAELETVTTDIIADIEEEIAFKFARRRGAPTRVGGTETAAKMLNRVAKVEGASILEGVDSKDPDIASAIRKNMLTFNDLESIDKRGFQQLLREVPTEDLVVALKTATEAMKEKIFSNVSSRAADQIREEMELAAPMRLSEVEGIQQQIVEIARRLEEEGKLSIDAGGSADALV